MDWSVVLYHVDIMYLQENIDKLYNSYVPTTLQDVSFSYFENIYHNIGTNLYQIDDPVKVGISLRLDFKHEKYDDLIAIARTLKFPYGATELLQKFYINWNVRSHTMSSMINLEGFLEVEGIGPIFRGGLPNPLAENSTLRYGSYGKIPDYYYNKIAWDLYEISTFQINFPPLPEFRKVLLREMEGEGGNPFEGDPMFSENTKFVGTVL